MEWYIIIFGTLIVGALCELYRQNARHEAQRRYERDHPNEPPQQWHPDQKSVVQWPTTWTGTPLAPDSPRNRKKIDKAFKKAGIDLEKDRESDQQEAERARMAPYWQRKHELEVEQDKAEKEAKELWGDCQLNWSRFSPEEREERNRRYAEIEERKRQLREQLAALPVR